MTFTEIVDEIADRLDLTASDDTTRIGRLVNQCYRKVTTSIGLQLSRRTNTNTTASISSSNITFSSCEKILNLYDRTVSPYKLLKEVTIDELREDQPYSASDNLTKWAVSSQTADTVVIEIDVIAQTAFSVYADIIATAATLSGSTEPSFPESYHDILIEGVLMNEYKKSEKLALAKESKLEYEQRLSDLKLWMALSSGKDQYQGKLKDSLTTGGSGGGSGSSVNGALSWTQTGLITFDRDPSAPFAVTASSAVVTNLDADLLDGFHETSFAKLADNETITGNWTYSGTLALNGVVTMGANLLFTDATYDIGASGATRPRDLFLSRNAVIGGTLGVTGVPTFTAQSVHNGGATFAGHLIATDATYDIGASGATRFRDLFLSRNAVIGGTLGVTGIATFSNASTILDNASAVLTFSGATAPEVLFSGATGKLSSNASVTINIDKDNNSTTEVFNVQANNTDVRLQLNEAGLLCINDTSNANMTTGLTINQGSSDNLILALKSSDVATGLTTGTLLQDVETDDYITISKRDATIGGLGLQILAETGTGVAAFIDAYAGAPDTDDTSASFGVVNFHVGQHNGSNTLQDMAANSNAFAWGEIDSGGSRLTRMLLKADDGELHLGNTTLVALDSEDDIMLVRDLQRVRTQDNGIAFTPLDKPIANYEALRRIGVVGEKDKNGEFLIRVQPYLNLHDGAIWALHTRLMKTEERTNELEQLRLEVADLKRNLLNS